jgi:hypothetical protein
MTAAVKVLVIGGYGGRRHHQRQIPSIITGIGW